MVIRRSLLTMLCSGGLALAQFTVTASHSEDQVTFTFGPDKVAADNAITGRPYSATLTSERTARDGTRMIQPARHVYRDSQGRTRTEEQHPTIYGAASFLAVEINDPVAGFAYVVDTENHVAHRLAIKVGSNRRLGER